MTETTSLRGIGFTELDLELIGQSLQFSIICSDNDLQVAAKQRALNKVKSGLDRIRTEGNIE